eukprot:6910773-Karenia_brevis.AAC.1
MANGNLLQPILINLHCARPAAHMAMAMGIGKLPCTTLVNFSCAARRACGAHGNDNGKWKATSHYQ